MSTNMPRRKYVLMECPVCKTKWDTDDYEECPNCQMNKEMNNTNVDDILKEDDDDDDIDNPYS